MIFIFTIQKWLYICTQITTKKIEIMTLSKITIVTKNNFKQFKNTYTAITFNEFQMTLNSALEVLVQKNIINFSTKKKLLKNENKAFELIKDNHIIYSNL